MTRLRAFGLFVGLVALMGPASLQAQAICSAPHAAPTLAASGSILLLQPGAGWIQAAARGVRSSEFFGSGGGTHDLPGVNTATTTSLYLTGAVGVLPGLELWAQLPLHRLHVTDPAQTRTRAGLGDPRFSIRVGTELLGLPAWPVSVRAGVKAPGSDFPVDPRILPLTEGQWDYELAAEAGAPLMGERLYVVAWAGYRWRALDASTGREPGDERFGHLGLGGHLRRVRLELGVDVLDGIGPRQNGLSLPASARELLQISPTLSLPVGTGRFELGAQVPVSGRNLPTGPALSLGYLFFWSGGPDLEAIEW